jgi:exodeoxyribonuclease V alpha subunit
VIQGWTPFLKAETIPDMFAEINNFRTLCVLRNGPYGVGMLNRIIEKILSETGLIFPKEKLYEKLPVMITKNDYRLNLYNGDTGIIAYDPLSKNVLKAWFSSVDRDKKISFRPYHPAQIPSYEISYAISIHKSQGSEFNNIHLILPDSINPVLTRELLYTGITRTRNRVGIYGKEPIFIKAVEQKISRVSGLRKKLYNGQMRQMGRT